MGSLVRREGVRGVSFQAKVRLRGNPSVSKTFYDEGKALAWIRATESRIQRERFRREMKDAAPRPVVREPSHHLDDVTAYRQIPGSPLFYADNHGRIWSMEADGPPKELHLTSLKNGYRQVTVDGEARKVHHVVAAAFFGEWPTDNEYVCHRNGDPADNRPTNLYYGAPWQNSLDRTRHGRGPGRFLFDDVIAIRKLHELGIPRVRIAEMFDCDHSSISDITLRRTWRFV